MLLVQESARCIFVGDLTVWKSWCDARVSSPRHTHTSVCVCVCVCVRVCVCTIHRYTHVRRYVRTTHERTHLGEHARLHTSNSPRVERVVDLGVVVRPEFGAEHGAHVVREAHVERRRESARCRERRWAHPVGQALDVLKAVDGVGAWWVCRARVSKDWS